MLGNFGAKWNFIILYFLLHSLPKNRFCTAEGADIYRRCKQTNSAFKKNWNIARNTMCFIMNVITDRQNFSAHLIYLLFSKFSYRHNMFWSRNLSPNTVCLKLCHFHRKIVKIAQRWELCPQTPMPPAGAGGGAIINAAFTCHKENDDLISKSAAAAVTDIYHCKLWRHTLCMTFWNHLCFGKFGEGGPLTSFLWEVSAGLDPTLTLLCYKAINLKLFFLLISTPENFNTVSSTNRMKETWGRNPDGYRVWFKRSDRVCRKKGLFREKFMVYERIRARNRIKSKAFGKSIVRTPIRCNRFT